MGWFSNEDIVTNTNSVINTPVEQILIATAVLIIALVILVYAIAKACKKVLNSRMSSAARREVEMSRFNNGTVRST